MCEFLLADWMVSLWDKLLVWMSFFANSLHLCETNLCVIAWVLRMVKVENDTRTGKLSVCPPSGCLHSSPRALCPEWGLITLLGAVRKGQCCWLRVGRSRRHLSPGTLMILKQRHQNAEPLRCGPSTISPAKRRPGAASIETGKVLISASRSRKLKRSHDHPMVFHLRHLYREIICGLTVRAYVCKFAEDVFSVSCTLGAKRED